MPEFGTILVGLLGGIALFLYGLERMTNSLNSVAGARMQAVLSVATSNPLRAAVTGAGLTAVLQSSSLTTVLCVGFISAGLMELRQAAGIIVGANVGTTITAQVIALDVSQLALPLVTLGIVLRFLAKNSGVKHLGSVVLGVGLVFYGMNLMTEATHPLRTYAPFIEFMQRLERPWLAILAGAAFTALVQSSSATAGLVIVLGSQSLISLEGAIALVLGANVGTCITATVAAWSRGAAARQGAAIHSIFNISGALVWWLLLGPLTSMTMAISGPDLARQIANAHTIFNLANALVFLGLLGPLAQLVEKLVPIPEPQVQGATPLYLDEAYLSVPSMALARVNLELTHLAAHALRLVRTLGQGEDRLSRVPVLTHIHEAIVEYLRGLTREEMTPKESRIFEACLVIANSLEGLGTVVAELDALERELAKSGAPFVGDIKELHGMTLDSLEQAVAAITDPNQAMEVLHRKSAVRACRNKALKAAAEHLDSDRPGAAGRYRLRSGVVDELRRVYYLASRVARAILRREGRNSPTGPLV